MKKEIEKDLVLCTICGNEIDLDIDRCRVNKNNEFICESCDDRKDCN